MAETGCKKGSPEKEREVNGGRFPVIYSRADMR
jgi:hypothetical protein